MSANAFVKKDAMKRAGQPTISHAGIEALNQYKAYLQQSEDMSPVMVRNYLSDLRQFIAWCESSWHEGQDSEQPFAWFDADRDVVAKCSEKGANLSNLVRNGRLCMNLTRRRRRDVGAGAKYLQAKY